MHSMVCQPRDSGMKTLSSCPPRYPVLRWGNPLVDNIYPVWCFCVVYVHRVRAIKKSVSGVMQLAPVCISPKDLEKFLNLCKMVQSEFIFHRSLWAHVLDILNMVPAPRLYLVRCHPTTIYWLFAVYLCLLWAVVREGSCNFTWRNPEGSIWAGWERWVGFYMDEQSKNLHCDTEVWISTSYLRGLQILALSIKQG